MEPKAQLSVMFSTQNVSIVNHIMQKLHAMGFSQVQSPLDNQRVAGRISHFATNWKVITEDQWVLRAVQGFLIPFREDPRQVHLPQPCRYAEGQMNLLRQEVTSLIKKGAVVTVAPSGLEIGFYSNLFLVPKPDGRMRPVINLKALNLWVRPQHFKMEGIHTLREIVAQDDWLAKLDLKDAYFTGSPNRSGTPEVPSICGGRNPISVYVSPIRSVLRSLGIHQGSKTGRCIPKKFRSSPYCLYRRYAGDREIPSRGCRSRGGTECSVRGSGFRYQQGEVHNNSISTDRVPGSAGGYFHYDPEPPRSQDQDDSGRSNSASSTGQYQCSKGSSVYWETKRCSPGSVPSSPVLSKPAERPSRGPGQGQSELRILTPTLSGISRGNSMVAGAPDTVEWSNLAETSPADGDSVRCLPDRVGGCLQGSSDRGSMVSRGTEDAHQLLRTDRSNASSAGFCQESTRGVNSIAAGQPNSGGLYQPPGWHCIPATSAVGKSAMAVGSSAGHNAVSPTYSRGDQSSGRCRVQSNRGSPRLEAVTISFSENQCHMGSTGGGSVCVTPVLSAEPVLQLEARSASRSNRCFSTGLGPSEGLCQPPLVSDRESSQASESPTGSGGSSGPSVDGSAMVSSSSGDALGLSSVDTSLAGFFSHDLQLSGNEFSAPASHMAYLREKFAHQNLSGTARDLLLASWRTKSNKTYDSHFKKWLCWCSARGSDPISGPVSEIANFLAHLHKEGYQSSSLNVFRSAISSVHDKVDGVEVGKHPTITRLLKGAFHERPPLPRYSSTWDVNAVLQYLKSLGPTSGLTLKQLTYKLVMLLALTRPSRSADLSSLSLARRRFLP